MILKHSLIDKKNNKVEMWSHDACEHDWILHDYYGSRKFNEESDSEMLADIGIEKGNPDYEIALDGHILMTKCSLCEYVWVFLVTDSSIKESHQSFYFILLGREWEKNKHKIEKYRKAKLLENSRVNNINPIMFKDLLNMLPDLNSNQVTTTKTTNKNYLKYVLPKNNTTTNNVGDGFLP
jgi:hypothetical protein